MLLLLAPHRPYINTINTILDHFLSKKFHKTNNNFSLYIGDLLSESSVSPMATIFVNFSLLRKINLNLFKIATQYAK